MEGVVIRNAGEKDIPAMVDLLGTLFAIEEDFDIDPAIQQQGLSLMLDGCGKHRCIKVAEIDGAVRGMCTVQLVISTAEGGLAGLVEDLVVDRTYRGQGIGGLLTAHIESWARGRGALRLQLLADKNNTPALGFYRGHGWETTQLTGLRKKWNTVLDRK